MQNIYLEKLAKAGFWFLVILSVFFVVLSFAAIKATGQIGSGVPVSNTITVSGEGEVFAVPDIASFSFSVNEERQTVEAAQEAVAKSLNSIIEFLEDSDIDDEDIRTTYYNLYPRYEYRTVTNIDQPASSYEAEGIAEIYPSPRDKTRVLVGYNVQQSISVKVRDTEKSGVILGGVGSLGATDISGLSFTIDDEDVLQREVRKNAIDDARDKAKELADDLGVNLVRVVSFSESGYPTPYYVKGFGGDLAFEESIALDAEIPVGENRIVSNVSITYEIR